MFDLLIPVGKYLTPYISEIAIGFIACMLVLLGGDINRFVRKLMVRQHFIVRTFVFILLNAFGYGLVIVKVTPYLSAWLYTLPSGLFCALVIGCFTAIGIWAQKHRHV